MGIGDPGQGAQIGQVNVRTNLGQKVSNARKFRSLGVFFSHIDWSSLSGSPETLTSPINQGNNKRFELSDYYEILEPKKF